MQLFLVWGEKEDEIQRDISETHNICHKDIICTQGSDEFKTSTSKKQIQHLKSVNQR
jgi:hypothetical protein